MKSMATNKPAQAQPALPSGQASAFTGSGSATGLSPLDGRLTWLDLNTRASTVHRSLNALFGQALTDTKDAARAGRFILSLWSPGRYHLDLNDLAYFEQNLNFACRHLMNFIIACQVDFRQLVTHSEMAPVIAAWGDQQQ